MRYRNLGRTGLKVGEIGFGTWSLGGSWGPRDDREAEAALREAFDLGVNFFDTAYVYGDGRAEELLGRALAPVRNQVVIATKVPPKTFEWPPRTDRLDLVFPAEWIAACTERSLRRLGTDHIDLQQLHCWRPGWAACPEWHEALVRLRDQGKIRFIGISSGDWEPDETLDAVEAGLADVVQVIYNLFEQRPADRLFPAALEHQVGIIARVPFEEGLLTGRLRPGHRFARGDWRAAWLTPERLAEAEPRLRALERELDPGTEDLPTLALRFVLAAEAVGAVIPGMRRREHVRANAAASERPPLPPARAAALAAHRWTHGWAYPWRAGAP